MNRNKTIAGIAGIAIIAFIWLQVWLPKRIDVAVEDALRASITAESISVDITSFPAAEIILGHVDRITIKARGIQGDVILDSATLDLRDVRYNALAVLRGTPVVNETIKSIGSGVGIATLTEANLNSYITKASGTKSLSIKLSDGVGIIRGALTFAGASVNASVRGVFRPLGNAIRYVPQGISVMDTELSGFIIEQAAGEFTVDIPLGNMPIPMSVNSVDVDKGMMKVYFAPTLKPADPMRTLRR